MSSDGLQLIVGEVDPGWTHGQGVGIVGLGPHRLGRVVGRALAVGAEMASDLAVNAVQELGMQLVAALLSVSRSVVVATDRCECRESRESVVWFIRSPCSMFFDDLGNFQVFPALHGTVSVFTTQLTVNVGLGVGRDVIGDGERPERARSFGVHHALRHALPVEGRHLFEELIVLHQQRTAWAGCQ